MELSLCITVFVEFRCILNSFHLHFSLSVFGRMAIRQLFVTKLPFGEFGTVMELPFSSLNNFFQIWQMVIRWQNSPRNCHSADHTQTQMQTEPELFRIHPTLWSSHRCHLLNYCDCVNHFLRCNGNSWTNRKCESAHLVQSNPLVID